MTRLARRDGFAPKMIYGARTAGDLPLVDWFEEECSSVSVTTEDGSRGEQGLVTAPLDRLLDEAGPAGLHLYACGPEPMLRAVAGSPSRAACGAISRSRREWRAASASASGCVVPTHGGGPDGDEGFERVCVEGPVMRAERLAW